MKILKIFLLLSSLFVFTYADDDYKEHKYKDLEYLKLNSEQVKSFKSILIKYKNLYEDFHDYEEDKEKEIKRIMENKPFDKELYIKILNEIKTKAITLEANKMEEIHNILEDNQRTKFAKYFEEWKHE